MRSAHEGEPYSGALPTKDIISYNGHSVKSKRKLLLIRIAAARVESYPGSRLDISFRPRRSIRRLSRQHGLAKLLNSPELTPGDP